MLHFDEGTSLLKIAFVSLMIGSGLWLTRAVSSADNLRPYGAPHTNGRRARLTQGEVAQALAQSGARPLSLATTDFDENGVPGLLTEYAASLPFVTQADVPVTQASVQFSAANYSVGEGDGRVILAVTRTGDTSGTATVDYRTADNDTFSVGCADTTNNQGAAFGRCDFATTVDTLQFAPGETAKTFTVPIIDDAHVEGNETFQVILSNPTGAALGTQSTATVTIMDNDVAGQTNPIFITSFFVRQQYLDFLSREPEAGEPWSGVLNNCPDVNNTDPNSPSASCDRILVSSSFFGSPEYRLKGFFVFSFYRVAFGRLPQYAEIIPDMRSVTGQTSAEVFQKKAAFANTFTQRAEFVTIYGALSNSAYVAALLNRYGLTSITTPDPANPDGTTKVTLTSADLTNRLNGGTLTRAQVLRAVADSDQVSAVENNPSFVALAYYGYFRRTPDTAGYNQQLGYLNAHPSDFRTFVNFFLTSSEYRARFGPTTLIISGRIIDAGNGGAAMPNVTVSLAGAVSASATTDNDGNYSFTNLPLSGSYTVTPSRANYTFTPATRSFSNLNSNQTANFTGTLSNYTISGHIANAIGTAFTGVTVTLSGTQPGTTQTDASGNYSFTNLMVGGNYTVTPSLTNYRFTPPSQTFTNLSANQSANFTLSIQQYTISGRVRDAQGNGVPSVGISLSGALATQTGTDANGFYSFTNLGAGLNYTVTPLKSGYAFSPASAQINNLSGDATADFTTLAVVRFITDALTFNEQAGSAAVGLTRTGDLLSSATVSYRTIDNPAAVRCDDQTTMPGVAFARCDYATTLDTITFAPNETSKAITIPLIDDAHVEPDETFQMTLSSAGAGAALGSPATVTVTIRDNDAPGQPNPIFATPFFVRQHYLDFLAREPEPGEPWSNILNNCANVNNTDPNSPSAGCDRITVSGAFFGSPEFLSKGVYTIVFYRAGFNRLPDYSEFAPDLRAVTGATANETNAKRAAFANNFVQRQEFVSQYGALSNADYVTTLLGRYSLTQITTPDPAQPDGTQKVTLTNAELVSRLNAQTLTRAQVLRAIVQSDEVSLNREAINAFVAAQYYGYLRRTPDTGGFNSWVSYLTAHPGDFRTMVNGFMNSTEYRLRFGPGQ